MRVFIILVLVVRVLFPRYPDIGMVRPMVFRVREGVDILLILVLAIAITRLMFTLDITVIMRAAVAALLFRIVVVIILV